MTLFTVQVWCSEQWMTLDGAESVDRRTAELLYAEEKTIAGEGRARMVPVHSVKLVYAEKDDPQARAKVVSLLQQLRGDRP